MNTVDNITSYPNQKLGLILDDGSKATLTLTYNVRLLAWYMTLEYGTTTITNRRVFSSPNMIRQWDKVLPFGLACYSIDGSDPYFIDDFTSGRCGLILLDSAEVLEYADYLQTIKT